MKEKGIVVESSTGICEKKLDRRRFLAGVSGAVGGGAGLLVASPFVASLRPSRKAQTEGMAVLADASGLVAGELRRVLWRLKPVWIFGRNREMLDVAKQVSENLIDPNSDSSMQPSYCKNEFRSIKPEVFVVVGICTHLGCSPGQVKDESGGFLCACHGSKFDVAGRVFKGSPAPKNLIVPPHYYASDGEIVIGEDKNSA